jgi:hypothetical protein
MQRTQRAVQNVGATALVGQLFALEQPDIGGWQQPASETTP